MSKNFDIWYHKPRKVMCARLYDTAQFGRCDYKKLEIGKIYHLYGVEVRDFYTYVYLREFPNEGFNSVYFDEVEGR